MRWVTPALPALLLGPPAVVILADDLGKARAILTTLAFFAILYLFWTGMSGSFTSTDSSMPRLLNLEPRLEDDAPDVVATRFPDGIVRLHVSAEHLRVARQLPVAEVQRSLILGWSVILGGDRRHDIAIGSLLGYPALHQAFEVCRMSGARWCLPQRPRFRTVVLGDHDDINRVA